jgi:hypothetical protein
MISKNPSTISLRCSDLFTLQWLDVLWKEKTLLVRSGIVTGGGVRLL